MELLPGPQRKGQREATLPQEQARHRTVRSESCNPSLATPLLREEVTCFAVLAQITYLSVLPQLCWLVCWCGQSPLLAHLCRLLSLLGTDWQCRWPMQRSKAGCLCLVVPSTGTRGSSELNPILWKLFLSIGWQPPEVPPAPFRGSWSLFIWADSKAIINSSGRVLLIFKANLSRHLQCSMWSHRRKTQLLPWKC